MENLKELINKQNHAEIMKLEGSCFDKYKVVAAIFLNLFEDALKFAERNSFEQAYVFYRLRKYRKALKTLRKLNSEKSETTRKPGSAKIEILKAQCLYNLGYYADAYAIIAEYGTNDEYGVNLTAIESLCSLSEQTRHKLSYFTLPFKGSIKNNVKMTFKNPECLIESEFNRLYTKIENERIYLDLLYDFDSKFNVNDSCFKKQIKLLKGEFISPEGLSSKEKETLDFNNKIISTISAPVHFQKNFTPSGQQYQLIDCLRYDKIHKFDESVKTLCSSCMFEHISDIAIIFKSFTYIKSSKIKRTELKVSKWLSKCDGCPEKDLLLALSSDLKYKENQQAAIKAILAIKTPKI